MVNTKKRNKSRNNNSRNKSKNKSRNYFEKEKVIKFNDYPDFKPNLTPSQIFKLGSFGGTYWRPIYSSVNNKKYKDQYLEFPDEWFQNIPIEHLTTPYDKYNESINKYKVKVGQTLEAWEENGWIEPQDPYGWMQWYCRFYAGRRSTDDERQISRWKKITGENGRFRKWLITDIINNNWKYNDLTKGQAKRQTLQHWAYKLTKKDFNKEIKYRQNRK